MNILDQVGPRHAELLIHQVLRARGLDNFTFVSAEDIARARAVGATLRDLTMA